MGLQNELDYEGYLLSVFSVGSHQLNYRHEYMAITGNAHVAARFMAAHARFHGLRAPDEIGYVLNGYDNDSEWPPGSGVPYLKYFAPGDFAAGHRLADCAGWLWKALVELSPECVRRHLEPVPALADELDRFEKRATIWHYGQEQLLRLRSVVARARFLKGTPVRAVWCQFFDTKCL